MLEIKGLSKTYSNGIKAIDNISLHIDCGIFGLLGANGAGKSSLMRTLATLQDADVGEIRLDGIDILKNPSQARTMLGYLPQDFGVYPQVSAEDLLNQLAVFKGFTNTKQRQEIVAHQLELVNLYTQRKQKLGTFSGGMRQRFGIAQALLGSPKLIVVDEPTAGLDPTERIRFQNLLAEISRDRVLLLSTHIVEDVADLCPQIAIMKRGQIINSGSPRSLVEELQGKVWQRKIEPEEELQANWVVITSRMRQGARWVRVLSNYAPDSSFESAIPDLDDVYFTAMLDREEVEAVEIS
ncbi:MAG: ABC transporter ATP-binding protein [Cyanobacteria bacterium P01_G01_bin.39]